MLVELVFKTPHPDPENLADLLTEHGALAVTVGDAEALSADEHPIFGEPGMPTSIQAWPLCEFSVLLSADTNPTIWWQAICAAAPLLKNIAFSSKTLADQDWVSATQRQFEPFRIDDRLWVGPSWLSPPDDLRESGVTIHLDPGMAFGTGSHATTQLCLEALLIAHDRLGPAIRVLDYGCGSGLLAIAAAKLGASESVGIDIDPIALDVARANADQNDVRLRLIHADAQASSAMMGGFDLVMANILSQPLKVLASLLVSCVKPGGHLVMSGILARQADEIISVYAPLTKHLGGVQVLASRDGWVAVGTPLHLLQEN